MEHLIVQEKAIIELQKLITKEDILTKCNNEVREELMKIQKEIVSRVES